MSASSTLEALNTLLRTAADRIRGRRSPRPEGPLRVFQIGYNKCGTRSLCAFFRRNGLTAVHWDRGRLATTLEANLAAGRPLLEGYESFTLFSDMEGPGALEFFKRFEEIDAACPGALFILNTRDPDDWIRSRLAHGDGRYAARHMKALGIKSREELVRYWLDDWHAHHARVRAYFARRRRVLLEFDIDRHDGKTLARFLAPWHRLDPTLYPWAGSTPRPAPEAD